ncbi:hematopoietic progenitor cell antigen CD34 [Esox lucius]|uniref:Si:ch211-286o17.1 n=1 Tax=Esox lucius TaxID=8010 RepID=A0A3P8XWM8_ESOLU|nr:hematopoietic progenitor cell antigen CD34 [Esox lucius]
MNETQKMLAFTLLFIVTLFHGGVVAQNEGDLNAVTRFLHSVDAAHRGDNTDTTLSNEDHVLEVQTMVFPDLDFLNNGNTVTERVKITILDTDFTLQTQAPRKTPASRTINIVMPEVNVMCVDKEAVQDRDAVSLKLKASSSCEETRSKIESVLEHLCGDDCKLEVFQEDNSNEILISGKYIEADVKGMAEKFNNDNIKDKIDFVEAVPRWGKNSKLVLVSLLISGVLLAILLITGFYLKTHHPPPKGAKLAEEGFQVDEENQANTLVSVAPLQSQEPLNKPTSNGESPDSQPPPTNGHSATQSPVADTEM